MKINISNKEIKEHIQTYEKNKKIINSICTEIKENKSYPKEIRNNFSNYDKIQGLSNTDFQKYIDSLQNIKKYINNVYIYSIFYDWGFTIENRFIPFHSNINAIEACFISLCVQTVLQKNPKSFSVLEIGLAYGTSSLILMNEMIKYSSSSKTKKIQYDILDPCQTKVWKDIGIKNIIQFQKIMNSNVPFTVHETVFQNIKDDLKKKVKKYNVIFIDGAHDYYRVLEDMKNADDLLEKNGIMILDDVLHGSYLNKKSHMRNQPKSLNDILKSENQPTYEQKVNKGGVYWAVIDFLKEKRGKYIKINIKEDDSNGKTSFRFIEDPKLFYPKKMSTVFNCTTMFCLYKVG